MDALRDRTLAMVPRAFVFSCKLRADVVRCHDRRGCFLCNAAVDQAPMDPEIQAKVLAMIKREAPSNRRHQC